MYSQLKAIFLHYGVETQLKKMEEELVELADAHFKYQKEPTGCNLEKLLLETADVLNVNLQFRLCHAVPKLIELPAYSFEMARHYKPLIEDLKRQYETEISRMQIMKIERTIKNIK